MRKAAIKISIVFSFAAIVCILISCNSVGIVEAEDVVTSFSGKMTVNQGGDIIECDICRNHEESAQIKITDPDSISGLSFKWNGTNNRIIFGELEAQNFILPETSFAQAIMNALAVSSKPENLTPEANLEKRNEFSGMCDSGKFRIVVTNQGLIEKIYIDNLELEATLNEIKEL